MHSNVERCVQFYSNKRLHFAYIHFPGKIMSLMAQIVVANGTSS